METFDRDEVPYHPLYRTLIVANALFSPDRATILPASGRRVPKQIHLLEALKEKRQCTKEELLSSFKGAGIQFWRYFLPLVRIGLVRKETVDGVTAYQISNRIELDFREESERIRSWLEEKAESTQRDVETVKTPLGLVKLKPAVTASEQRR